MYFALSPMGKNESLPFSNEAWKYHYQLYTPCKEVLSICSYEIICNIRYHFVQRIYLMLVTTSLKELRTFIALYA